MKRRDLIRHLAEHDCQLLREGGNHSIYANRATKKTSTVPRHNEINNDLARKIARISKCHNPTPRLEVETPAVSADGPAAPNSLQHTVGATHVTPRRRVTLLA